MYAESRGGGKTHSTPFLTAQMDFLNSEPFASAVLFAILKGFEEEVDAAMENWSLFERAAVQSSRRLLRILTAWRVGSTWRMVAPKDDAPRLDAAKRVEEEEEAEEEEGEELGLWSKRRATSKSDEAAAAAAAESGCSFWNTAAQIRSCGSGRALTQEASSFPLHTYIHTMLS